jgi:hypothetical protein
VKEVAYYKGEGEVIIKTKQKGLATYVAILILTGSWGYSSTVESSRFYSVRHFLSNFSKNGIVIYLRFNANYAFWKSMVLLFWLTLILSSIIDWLTSVIQSVFSA